MKSKNTNENSKLLSNNFPKVQEVDKPHKMQKDMKLSLHKTKDSIKIRLTFNRLNKNKATLTICFLITAIIGLVVLYIKTIKFII